jgi:prepilin-type N-terminal cleavage/methylation domain-containing protein
MLGGGSQMRAELASTRTKAGWRGFTLIELLVIIAIVGILAAMLMPGLTKAKQQAQMTQCLSNLRQIGIGLELYVDANQQTFPPGDSQQFNPNSEYWNYGNALGGADPLTAYYPLAKDRLLAPYVSVQRLWRCPGDCGFQRDPDPNWNSKVSVYENIGSSYRLNWDLQLNYVNRSPAIAQDPAYNLAGKKEIWLTDPGRFIALHEMAAYPWNTVDGDLGVAQWHYSANPGVMFSPAILKNDPDKFVAPIVFADGHSGQCDFTKTFKANPQLPLEPGIGYIWYKPVK